MTGNSELSNHSVRDGTDGAPGGLVSLGLSTHGSAAIFKSFC
jgi:hypothetical protein